MDYEMPKVQLGDIVFWFPGGNPTSEPSPAIVTRAGRDNLCLNIISPTSFNFLIRDGVRHCKDPRAPVDQKEEGGWMYREEYFEVQATRENMKQRAREKADEQARAESKAKLQPAAK
jgi:hypothetical protein